MIGITDSLQRFFVIQDELFLLTATGKLDLMDDLALREHVKQCVEAAGIAAIDKYLVDGTMRLIEAVRKQPAEFLASIDNQKAFNKIST